MEKLNAWLTTEGRFWAIVVGAALVKSVLSDRLGWKSVLVTFGTAFFSAYVFTDPVMHYFALAENYREIAAVAVALTGEQIMRAVILATSDAEFLKDLIRKRLGK